MSDKTYPWSRRAGRLTGRLARRAASVLAEGRWAAERIARGVATAGGQGSDPAEDAQMALWYANLELPYGSDLAAVHRARKRLLARYHPDRFAVDPERARRAHELTLALNEAHRQLVERLTP